MAKRPVQQDLLALWSKGNSVNEGTAKRNKEDVHNCEVSSSTSNVVEDLSLSDSEEVDSAVEDNTPKDCAHETAQNRSQSVATPSECTRQCCSTDEMAYQPTDKAILAGLAAKKRNFQPNWYQQYSWLTICTTQQKAFCLYCRWAIQSRR